MVVVHYQSTAQYGFGWLVINNVIGVDGKQIYHQKYHFIIIIMNCRSLSYTRKYKNGHYTLIVEMQFSDVITIFCVIDIQTAQPCGERDNCTTKTKF